MKDFLKYTLATVCGIILVNVFAALMFFIMVGALGAIGSLGTGISSHSVLRINLSGTLTEQSPAEDPFAELFGNENLSKQGLDQLIKAIRAAKDNDDIDGIYLSGGALMAHNASLHYLRTALEDFRESGKFIVAYADTYTQPGYYVASVADSVVLNPDGMLDWHGFSAQPTFYTGLLKKIGVKEQVFKVGTYKSYVEPFILTKMSDANREQVTSYLTDMWSNLTADVSKSRKLSVDSLNALADRYTVLADAEEVLSSHLVDKLSYIDGVRDMLRSLTGRDEVKFVSVAEMADAAPAEKGSDRVAVYYAEGGINTQAGSFNFNNDPEIIGDVVVRDLDRLASDDHVKAVVLRINSGGGSAYASDQMWRAIQLLKEKKPVVVSMGDYAASGGYYMSCGASYIIAEPTTLTGSIGIFGMIPDASELLTSKLGLSYDCVKTNESADFGAEGRPFNEAESKAFQAYIDRGYKQFITRVADGRTAAGHKFTLEQVDSIAQGRVWTGHQALGLGLVDQLGSLDDAIAKAAELAKVEKYRTVTYPAPASWMDKFSESEKKGYLESRVTALLGEYYEPLQFVLSIKEQDMMQARMFYFPNIK